MLLAACLTLAAVVPSATAAERVSLPCVPSGPNATGPHAKDFCWIDWSNLPLRDGTTPVRIGVRGGHVDADLTLTHSANSVWMTRDYSGQDRTFQFTPAYALAGAKTALGFGANGPGRADRSASVTFTDISAVPDGERDVLKDFRMAFADAEVMSGAQDGSGYERTDLTSDKPLESLGWVGDDDPAHSYQETFSGLGTTHVTLAGGGTVVSPGGNYADSAGALVAGAKEPKTFTVDFRQVNGESGLESAIAVGVYMPYLTPYPLVYDANGGVGTLPEQKD